MSIGQRIAVISDCKIKGKQGTIVYVGSWGVYGIKFDDGTECHMLHTEITPI